MSEFVVPYTHPGSTVLRNRFGIEDRAALELAEYEASWIRREQIAEGAVTGNFDLAHLQTLHDWLFQDIFEWAGLLRTVNISKGTSRFLHAGSLLAGAQYTFEGDPLRRLVSGALSEDDFLDNAALVLGDINYIHPFREGNGRTLRAFLDQLAAHGGREFAWRNVTEAENITASATAVHDPFTPVLREMLVKVLAPPLDGLSVLDAGIYKADLRWRRPTTAMRAGWASSAPEPAPDDQISAASSPAGSTEPPRCAGRPSELDPTGKEGSGPAVAVGGFGVEIPGGRRIAGDDRPWCASAGRVTVGDVLYRKPTVSPNAVCKAIEVRIYD